MRNSAKALVAAAFALAACTPHANVSGILKDAPERELTVRMLNVNVFETLDTLTTGKDGSFSYKFKMEKGQPEFLYFFHNGVKVASAILSAGDNVEIQADTLGSYTVSGSADSELLSQVEKDFSDFNSRMIALSESMETQEPGSEEYENSRRTLAKMYVDYYRDRIKFVMSNVHSMTVIPVLYQKVGNLPVFAQKTDAVIFRNVCDSIASVYPESRYVAALNAEAERRGQYLALENQLLNAEQRGFPELALPDINGKTVKLSEVESKVILLHFWNINDADQKMFNVDFLKPLYEQYHSKGLEIVEVAMNADKSAWASIVKGQKLPWINLCDLRASSSPIAAVWNIASLPVSFVIADDAIVVDQRVSDEDGLRKLIASKLE